MGKWMGEWAPDEARLDRILLDPDRVPDPRKRHIQNAVKSPLTHVRGLENATAPTWARIVTILSHCAWLTEGSIDLDDPLALHRDIFLCDPHRFEILFIL